MVFNRATYFTKLALHYTERQWQKYLAKNFAHHLEQRINIPTKHDALRAAIDWLCNAQDNNRDGGISRGFSLVYDPKFNKTGWQPSYPETSGYIIPTLLRAAQFLKEPNLIERTKKIAAWEISIMTSEGGIPGGNIGKDPKPAVFDTGQVIRGFIALFEETKDTLYLDAATRAANWVLKNEFSNTGQWLAHNADSVNPTTTVYNIYAIVPIVYLGQLTHNTLFIDLGKRVAEFTLKQQNAVGWFKYCDFEDRTDALLHTLGYTIDGLWDIGILLNEERYLTAARLSVDNLLRHLDSKGLPKGRFNNIWQTTVDTYCLTGIAQIAITAIKIRSRYSDPSYTEFIERSIAFLMSKQNMTDPSFGGLGALWGSWPINGDYQPYQALNWAVKYLTDLLLMHQQTSSTASLSSTFLL